MRSGTGYNGLYNNRKPRRIGFSTTFSRRFLGSCPHPPGLINKVVPMSYLGISDETKLHFTSFRKAFMAMQEERGVYLRPIVYTQNRFAAWVFNLLMKITPIGPVLMFYNDQGEVMHTELRDVKKLDV
jgi:hypothetical protein